MRLASIRMVVVVVMQMTSRQTQEMVKTVLLTAPGDWI